MTIGSLGYGNKYYVKVKTYKASGGEDYNSSPSAAKTVTTPVLSQEKAKSKITGPLCRAAKKYVLTALSEPLGKVFNNQGMNIKAKAVQFWTGDK